MFRFLFPSQRQTFIYLNSFLVSFSKAGEEKRSLPCRTPLRLDNFRPVHLSNFGQVQSCERQGRAHRGTK